MKVTRSLLRGLEVLEVMAAVGGPLGPGRLAERVGLDKATVSRLLATFQQAGYVAHDPDTGRYWLTNRVLRLSRGFLAHSDLRGLARPHLVALRDLAGETVHLGQLDGDSVVYIDKLEADRSIRLVSTIGQAMPVHTTSLGKAMLAAMDPLAREAVLDRLHFAARTERSVTSREGLLAQLEEVAVAGYATDLGENEDNVQCVGAVLRDREGRVVGAVSVSGPWFRVDPRLADLGAQCRATAERISAELAEVELAPMTVPRPDPADAASPTTRERVASPSEGDHDATGQEVTA